MLMPVIDMRTDEGRGVFKQRLRTLRAASSSVGEYARTAGEIIERVRREGDAAIVAEMRRWTDPDFTADRIRVSGVEIDAALDKIDSDLRVLLEKAIEHVRAYQAHILPKPIKPIEIDGAELGLRFTPVERVGLTVPGGSAVLFSSIIMLAVPAQVAGVARSRISVVNPPPYREAGEAARDISPVVMATCKLLGIERVYRIGGPAAVAALAFGTETVEAVDLVVGPGHPVVAAAQGQVRGLIGTGDFYGASEIVTVADASANPKYIAADLIAQAEHNPGKCFLVTWSGEVIDRILNQIQAYLPQRRRRGAIEKALKEVSAAIHTADRAQAVEVANRLAPEHLNLAVADAHAMLGEIRHAGEVFLGDQTPVAAGDYWAGPSHTLPTDTTARFASGVSVYTFLKRSGTVCYPSGVDASTIEAITRLAMEEGLDGHAESVRVRG